MKQNWIPGAFVKIGFLRFTVVRRIPTPGDGLPDKWLLLGQNGAEYEFTPYNGLQRIN